MAINCGSVENHKFKPNSCSKVLFVVDRDDFLDTEL